MAVKGITRRWMLNSLGLILALLVVIVFSFSFAVRSFYYSGVRQTINGSESSLNGLFVTAKESPARFLAAGRSYVENFQEKERMELMLINDQGEIEVTSTGFPPDKGQPIWFLDWQALFR